MESSPQAMGQVKGKIMGFHVPRVTIRVDFGKEASFGELSLISLGYGLHQAWIYSSMFDKSGIFGSTPLEITPLNGELTLAYFASILIYGLVLLIASILDTRLIRFLHATSVLAAAAGLGCLGTLLLLDPFQGALDGTVLNVASGLLTGAGSAILLLAWGIAFARRDSASIIINGALSIAIGFGVYGLVLHQEPFPFSGIASALIPLAELALLLVLRRRVSLDFDNRRLLFQPLPINHTRFVFRFGIPVFLLGMALGIMRQTSIGTVLPGTVFDDQALLFVTACCAMVIIMVTFLALGGNERWHTLFRPLLPFIAVTAVFIPFTAEGNSFWGTSIVLVGYMSFEALMWIFFSELAQRFRLSPIFVFGLGRGVMALAALGGSSLPLFTGGIPLVTTFGDLGTVLIVIIAMMLAYALLPDEREMARILAVDPHQVAAVRNISRTPLIEVREGAGTEDGIDGMEGDAAEEGIGSPIALSSGEETPGREAALRDGDAPDAMAPQSAVGNGAPTDGGTLGDGNTFPIASAPREATAALIPTAAQGFPTEVSPSGAPAIPGATAMPGAVGDPTAPAAPAAAAAPAQPSAARQAMDPSRSIFADSEGGATAAEDEARRSRFRERCEIVANTYLLSRRENEVMYYLARGYKSTFIQQQLYISEGTAKTHIRHIYRKLNIHSQQDLIRLIDEVEL